MVGNMFKKGLIIGIIILLLGLSIQPSLGTEIPVTREIEFNEDIEECKPCKLIELLREYRDLKFKNFKFSNIINKLNSINNERLICYILEKLTYFTFFQFSTILAWTIILEEYFTLMYDLLGDFLDSRLESLSNSIKYYRYLYTDVYDCDNI